MDAAAAAPQGAGGMPQETGREVPEADQGATLPAKVKAKKSSRSERMYGKKKGKRGFAEGGEVKAGDTSQMSDTDWQNYNEFMKENARQDALEQAQAAAIK